MSKYYLQRYPSAVDESSAIAKRTTESGGYSFEVFSRTSASVTHLSEKPHVSRAEILGLSGDADVLEAIETDEINADEMLTEISSTANVQAAL